MRFDRDGRRRTDSGGRLRRSWFLVVLAGASVGLLFGMEAMGQANAPSEVRAQGDELVVSIREVSKDSKRISVSLRKSLIVDTNLPIRRASVTAPEIADVVVLSPKKLLVTGKSFGSTQLILWTEDSQQELFDLSVVFESAELERLIRQISPRSRVRVQPVLDSLVLSGLVPDAGTAAKVMQVAGTYASEVHNQMQVAGVQQVLLRCTVAEVSKRALRRLGVNGWMAGDHFQDVFMVQQIGLINPANIGAAADVNVAGAIPFLTDRLGIPISGPTTFSFGFPSLQMQIFVQALRENGLLRVLAEPNLVALSGQTASFLAGGEFPVPIPQDQGTITIEFKEFGVQLNFTPTVIGGQVIRLKVMAEVSEPDFTTAVQFAGFVVPGLTQRRVLTTVELGNGQTVAIAGLLSEQIRGVARKIPGLGDVPVLGALFSSVEYQRNKTELVILVTPELIEPMNPNQMITPLPGEMMLEPDDHELFGLGLLEGRADDTPPVEPEDAQLELELEEEPALSPVEAGEPHVAAHPTGLWLSGPWGTADSQEEVE